MLVKTIILIGALGWSEGRCNISQASGLHGRRLDEGYSKSLAGSALLLRAAALCAVSHYLQRPLDCRRMSCGGGGVFRKPQTRVSC